MPHFSPPLCCLFIFSPVLRSGGDDGSRTAALAKLVILHNYVTLMTSVTGCLCLCVCVCVCETLLLVANKTNKDTQTHTDNLRFDLSS